MAPTNRIRAHDRAWAMSITLAPPALCEAVLSVPKTVRRMLAKLPCHLQIAYVAADETRISMCASTIKSIV
jgi:hypothetical protein